MQFIDLKSQYEALKERIDNRIQTVLNHGQFIMGPEVQELEQKLSEYVDIKHTITCANGTDALQLALMTLGIQPGDIVFTTPFTFFATAEVIALIGAKPVFIDIDPRTFNIDPQKLEDEIVRRQKAGEAPGAAVTAVDLFGLPSDYTVLEPLCSKHGLHLIEDAAQGFGGAIGARKAGSFGDIATTSFFPAKPLGCYGDGGAVFTNNDEYAEKLRSLRFHGKGTDKYDNVLIGLNSRLDTLQAAILLEKLAAFPVEYAARQELAYAYSTALHDRFLVPWIPEGFETCWAQYSLLAQNREERDRVIAQAKARGIPIMIYYPKPLHLLKAMQYLGVSAGDFPVSEQVSERIFSLPMHGYSKQPSNTVLELLVGE